MQLKSKIPGNAIFKQEHSLPDLNIRLFSYCAGIILQVGKGVVVSNITL